MPSNLVPVSLFNQVLRQDRVGLDGVLIGVMHYESAVSAIQNNLHLFPDGLAANNCLRKMQVLADVVFKLWSDQDERQRKLRDAESKQRPGRKSIGE